MAGPGCRAALCYSAVAVCLSFTWMFGEITVPNERSRVYLSVALVDHHSLSIDRAVRRFGTTADIARFGDRYYTDKAPGASFLGAGVYGLVRLFTPPERWHIRELINLMRTALMIPIGLIGFFVLRRWLFELGNTPWVVNVASLGWILGTSAFHYSTAFYGHQVAAVGLMAGLYLAGQRPGRPYATWRSLGAGMAVGVAGMAEYQSIIPAGFVFIYVVVVRRSPRDIVWFAGGAAPFALVLLAYNWAAFGGPFELPYHHLSSNQVQALHSSGIAGVSAPRAAAIFGALLSRHRGLLTTSPIFLLIPFGIWRLCRDRQRALTVTIAAIVVYYLWFIFSAEVWYAGWSFGPRLLVPMMGVAMVPVAAALNHYRRVAGLAGLLLGLAFFGILYHQTVHFVFPELPENAQNPLLDLVLPAIGAGVHSPNIVSTLIGRASGWSVVVPAAAAFAVIGNLVLGWPHSRPLSAKGPLRLFRDPRGIIAGSRLRFCLASVCAVLPLSALLLLTDATWSEAKTDRFLAWMERMGESEYGP